MRAFSASRFGALACAITLSLGLVHGAAADTIVYSNNPTPGDWVPGTSPDASVAIGSSGWYYNNVRTGGAIGIRDNYAHNGNGSVMLTTNGTNTAKADVEMFNLTTGGFGKLSDLSAFSYSWYRDAASTSANYLAPALRLWISDGTHSGYMVYEPVYNAYPTSGPGVPTNTWITTDAYDHGNGVFWTTGSLPSSGGSAYLSFSQWVTAQGLGNYNVYGINSGFGSGITSGTFIGAVDGITIGFGGHSPTVYNFEVVPEPSSIVLSVIAGGLGLLEVARRRFRRTV